MRDYTINVFDQSGFDKAAHKLTHYGDGTPIPPDSVGTFGTIMVGRPGLHGHVARIAVPTWINVIITGGSTVGTISCGRITHIEDGSHVSTLEEAAHVFAIEDSTIKESRATIVIIAGASLIHSVTGGDITTMGNTSRIDELTGGRVRRMTHTSTVGRLGPDATIAEMAPHTCVEYADPGANLAVGRVACTTPADWCRHVGRTVTDGEVISPAIPADPDAPRTWHLIDARASRLQQRLHYVHAHLYDCVVDWDPRLGAPVLAVSEDALEHIEAEEEQP